MSGSNAHIFALSAMDLGFHPVSVPFLFCVDLVQNCVCQGWRESQNLRVDILLNIGVHIFEVNIYLAPHKKNPTFWHIQNIPTSFPMCRIRRLQGLSKSIKEREEKEREMEEKEKEMKKVNKEEEEMNEVDSPQFSLRPSRGFRPSTKREQIRMKLQQSKKKVCSR